MVCVKGCKTERDKWFAWLPGLCEGMDCVWSLWSDTIQTVCNTENDKWFVWKGKFDLTCSVLHIVCFGWRHGLCDLYPSLHPIQIIHNTENDKWFVWRDGYKSHTNQTICDIEKDGLCEGMVCVKGWFVWRDGLCEGILHSNHLSFCVLHPFTQTI